MLKDCWCFGISSCYKLIARTILHEHPPPPLNGEASALCINYKLALNNNSYGDTFLSLYCWLVYINYNQWSPNTHFVKSNVIFLSLRCQLNHVPNTQFKARTKLSVQHIVNK